LDTAASYNQTPQASLLVREGNRAIDWRLGRIGRTIDMQAAENLIAQALEQPTSAVATLPVLFDQPPPGDLEALGIVGVLGVGNSQFASYSSPNRDANVISGGKEFDGLIIAPGETLSFNQTVGEITADKGYAMGEMISGGQVVPSFGGGICQVSTTLFRAAFWSGLDIEERHFHAWRLDWYEADAPPGMDATIALGGPDLKIHNSTNAHILIDVETNLDAKTQTFTLYGSPQNIEVALVGPTWHGGGVVIERSITHQGTEIDRDSWASFYQ
jgi:vancomycin resistance protein YoaR